MIRDPPILVFILRDWLLVRHFPIDSIPAWIFGLPRFYNAPTSAPGAFLESFVDLFYDAIVAPPVLPKVCSLEEKVRFQSMDEDGCGEIADESDSDSDGELEAGPKPTGLEVIKRWLEQTQSRIDREIANQKKASPLAPLEPRFADIDGVPTIPQFA